MTEFEIPPLPTDAEIMVQTFEFDPLDQDMVLGRRHGMFEMRDQLAPHQLAAERMYEALSDMECSSDSCCRDDLCINCKIFGKAFADVKKIYEMKK
jgi:hypothetical protein